MNGTAMQKNKPISAELSSNIPFRSTLIITSPWMLVATGTNEQIMMKCQCFPVYVNPQMLTMS